MRAGSIPATLHRRQAQGKDRKARSRCDRAFFIIRRFCSDVDKFALPLPSPRLRLGEAQGQRPLRRGRGLPARYPRSRKLCPTSSQHQIAPNASKPSYFVALLFSPISGSSTLRISNGLTLYALQIATIWSSFNFRIPFSYSDICLWLVFSILANSVCVILCFSLNVFKLFIFSLTFYDCLNIMWL